MDQHDDERLLQSVAIENAKAILSVRRRAERDLLQAKEALELKTRELTHSLALLRATLDSTADGILVTDEQGNVIDFNEQYLAMWRLPRDVVTSGRRQGILEAMGQQVADTRAFLDGFEAIYLYSPAETFDALHLVDGRVFERVSRLLVVNSRNVGRVWSFRDVSHSRRAYDALQRLAAIVESSDDAIVGKTLEGVITAWNGGAERIFGYTAREAVGQHITLIIPAERRAEEDDVLARLRRGERIDHFETVRQAKDGRRIDISLTVSPVRDAEGRIIGASKVARDITRRKRAEQERAALLAREQAARTELEAALAETKAARDAAEWAVAATADAYRELDQFAYVASHDLKAPLRGIANLAQWIQEDLGEGLGPESRKHIALLQRRVRRMEALIDGILAYSRAGRRLKSPERVDTGALVREAIELLAPPPEVTIEVPTEMPTLEAERVPLQQVFINLIGNAVKYARAKRTDVVVRVSWCDAGDAVEFAVSDNGPGIAPEYHERIWGMFETLETRDKVEGTGIGLSVVKKVVETRGGRAWVESSPGQGATFRFAWPKAGQHRALA
jgi:PAS domain S-box-containing protein